MGTQRLSFDDGVEIKQRRSSRLEEKATRRQRAGSKEGTVSTRDCLADGIAMPAVNARVKGSQGVQRPPPSFAVGFADIANPLNPCSRKET